MGKRPVFKSEAYCDGYGSMVCHCGGDLCVCGEDGDQCIGCEKCDRDDLGFMEDDPLQQESSQDSFQEKT